MRSSFKLNEKKNVLLKTYVVERGVDKKVFAGGGEGRFLTEVLEIFPKKGTSQESVRQK